MKGICFKEPLFLKVVAGEKIQTRRLIKNVPKGATLTGTGITGTTCFEYVHRKKLMVFCCNPRYRPGETVYLKEPYFVLEPEHCESMAKRFVYKYLMLKLPDLGKLSLTFEEWRKEEYELGYETYYWHNKLFMPEIAARYFIKIEKVRAERVQEITEAEAILEGFTGIADFQNTWISLHGFSSWPANPWVFAYDFECQVKTEGIIPYILRTNK